MSDMQKTIGAVMAILALLSTIAVGVRAYDAIAQSTERNDAQQDVLDRLSDIHDAQATAEEAEDSQIRKLCRQGKLDPDGDECLSLED